MLISFPLRGGKTGGGGDVRALDHIDLDTFVGDPDAFELMILAGNFQIFRVRKESYIFCCFSFEWKRT